MNMKYEEIGLEISYILGQWGGKERSNGLSMNLIGWLVMIINLVEVYINLYLSDLDHMVTSCPDVNNQMDNSSMVWLYSLHYMF